MGNFGPLISWVSSYGHKAPRADKVEWLNTHEVEYVPAVSWKKLYLPDGSYCRLVKVCNNRCDVAGASCDSGEIQAAKERYDACMAKNPMCTKEHATEVLQHLKTTFKDSPTPPKYLLGWNEPYDQNDWHKMWEPADAADVWRRIIQPAAQSTGFQLISPSTKPRDNARKKGLTWFVDFIKACWDNAKNDPPCNVDLIKAIAIHIRTCQATWWNRYFDEVDKHKTTRKVMKDKLAGYTGKGSFAGGPKDWAAFIEGLPFWATETNCNYDDRSFNLKGAKFPTEQQTCERLTGQLETTRDLRKFGIGSIRWAERSPVFDRYSWWCTTGHAGSAASIQGSKNVILSDEKPPRLSKIGQALNAIAADPYKDVPYTEVDCTTD